MDVVRAIKPARLTNQGLIDFLRESLRRAEAGDLLGVLVIARTRGDYYEYTRFDFSFEESIGLHQRAAYLLNHEWDTAR